MNKLKKVKLTGNKVLELQRLLIEVSRAFYHPTSNKFSYAVNKNLVPINKLVTYLSNLAMPKETKALIKFREEAIALNMKHLRKDEKGNFIRDKNKQPVFKDIVAYKKEIKELEEKHKEANEQIKKANLRYKEALGKEYELEFHCVEESFVAPMPAEALDRLSDMIVPDGSILELHKL